MNRRVALVALLLAALVVRLLFISSDGFTNDVSTFEAWAITLRDHSLAQFYGSTSFADYPPGYFYVLWVIGHLYGLVGNDPGFAVLKVLVKAPAIIMDSVDGLLIFALVRRFRSYAWALAAAAIYLFNPASIFVSAYWGQVDSVSSGLVLAAIYCVFTSRDKPGRAGVLYLAAAWLALAYSILIKPPAAVLVPLFLLYPFTAGDAAERAKRIRGTLAGGAAALLLAYVLSAVMHPGNPLAVFAWLYERYAFGRGVYPYNSVNAFNLYAIRNPFWQSDAIPIPNVSLFGGAFQGFPQYEWGVALLAAAIVLVLNRYFFATRERSPESRELLFLEAAALLSLSFFILSTRMHERYIFDALSCSRRSRESPRATAGRCSRSR